MPGKGRYKKEFVERAFDLCLLGATNEQMAEFFHVSKGTIGNWQKKHPEFADALKKGKMGANAKVARSLYERACGYSCPHTKVFCYEGKIITHTMTKHYPPDTNAAFIFLKNRAGWVDRRELVGVGGEAMRVNILVTKAKPKE